MIHLITESLTQVLSATVYRHILLIRCSPFSAITKAKIRHRTGFVGSCTRHAPGGAVPWQIARSVIVRRHPPVADKMIIKVRSNEVKSDKKGRCCHGNTRKYSGLTKMYADFSQYLSLHAVMH
jgi:hypothetical protein